MKIKRRGFLTLVTSAAALTLSAGLASAAPPYDQARILVGYPPGGFTDATARILAEALQPQYASAIVVENKPGAGGRIALNELRRSPPSGNNMLVQIESILTLVPLVDDTVTVTLDDVQPVTPVAAIRHAFAVGPAVPEEVKTLEDFIAWAKANPEKADYGSPGVNTSNRLFMTEFGKEADIKLNHIPYKGSAQGLIDLLGGRLAAMSSPIGDYLPYLTDGRLRVLALASASRSPLAPDVPTFAEQGYPTIVADETAGMYMLKGASAEDVEAAKVAVAEVLKRPNVVETLARIGLEVLPDVGKPYEQHLNENVSDWKRRVDAINFTKE